MMEICIIVNMLKFSLRKMFFLHTMNPIAKPMNWLNDGLGVIAQKSEI